MRLGLIIHTLTSVDAMRLGLIIQTLNSVGATRLGLITQTLTSVGAIRLGLTYSNPISSRRDAPGSDLFKPYFE